VQKFNFLTFYTFRQL